MVSVPKFFKSRLFLTLLVVLLLLIFVALPVYKQISKTPLEQITETLPKEETSYLYQGHAFFKEKIGWMTVLNRSINGNPFSYELRLRYGPKELENIPVKGNISLFFPSNKTYISFYPKEKMGNFGLAVAELLYSLTHGFFLFQPSPLNPVVVCSVDRFPYCTAPGVDGKPLPIVNCSSREKKVIAITQDTIPYITLDHNCLIVAGSEETIVKSVDRLLYTWLGIMQPSEE